MAEQDKDLNMKAQLLLKRLFQGLDELRRLDVEQLEKSTLADLHVILAYLPQDDRQRLLHSLSEKSGGLALRALEDVVQTPSAELPQAVATSFLSTLNTYQRQQSFDALFAPEAIAKLSHILERGQ